MFLGTTDHQNIENESIRQPFALQAWTFNAEAPIRSTTAYDNNNIYFGAGNGFFYSVSKRNGELNWKYNTNESINSSALIHNNEIYFSNNKQTLFSLNKNIGKLNWKITLGDSKDYAWGFDYYYCSPTFYNNKIFIGSKGSSLFCINSADGKILWNYKTDGIVRSTPAIKDDVIFFGDTQGTVYALQTKDAKPVWKFRTKGFELNNDEFGFDRKAIIASPVIVSNKVIVGGRDGFLYAINKYNGELLWKMDHSVSWVISSVAVKDSTVVTGTSDGHFVQEIDLNTGIEKWKFKTAGPVWSSPIITGDKVYVGSSEGLLYCLNLKTGNKIEAFQANGKTFSSPVITDSLLFFGTDRGVLYALKSETNSRKKYVFYDGSIKNYFQNGIDQKIKNFPVKHNYDTLNREQLLNLLNNNSASESVIVFASNFFPSSIIQNDKNSAIRKYLNNGGRIVLLGMNPIIYERDSTGQVTQLNFFKADSVLNIRYGNFNGLRSMHGIYAAFPTDYGKKFSLPKFWTAFLSAPANQFDIVLAKDENGLASAWIKKYSKAKGSGLIQIWAEQDVDQDYNYILNVTDNNE